MKQSYSKSPALTRLCAAAIISSVAGFAAAAVPDHSLATPAAAYADFTDRIIVKYRDSIAAAKTPARVQPLSAERLAALQQVGRQHGVALSALHGIATGANVIKLDKRLSVDQVHAIASQIQAQDQNVEYAEPDRLLQPTFTPNDTRYSEQWHYFETAGGIRAPAAWDKSTGTGVTVAVIDTGYRPHADLAANIVGGYDFISDTFVANDGNGRDSDARDPGDWIRAGECGNGQPTRDYNSSWHGTHVAGTIAAVTNNGTGVAGIAFNAKVVPARVLGKCGGYTSDIVDAIVWSSGGSVSGVPANANPARVINMSLGGGGACGSTMQSAINSARSRGTVVVVAAGNSNANASNFTPANCAGVVTIASTNRSGGKAWYSNYGTIVDVAAPGGDTSVSGNGVLSTLNTGTTTPGSDSYAFYQGTSMAAPHVAGTVALMLSKNPSMTPDQVESRLKSTARPFPAACSGCGTGIIDASAAIDGPIDDWVTINETESNNSMSTANSITNRKTQVNGNMGSTTDNDYFTLQLPPGATLTATLTPNSSSDYDLYVYNSAGYLIGSSINGTGAVDTVSVTNTGSSTFTRYVRVRYYSGGTGSTNGQYNLKVTW